MPTQNVLVVRRRAWILGLVAMAGCAAALLVAPVPQDPSYHLFADDRTILGVPNFWNVVSNGGYLVVCIHALRRLAELPSPLLRPAYLTFGIAMMFVAAGSSYYHLAPSTPRLVWDRLPMSIAFMALFASVLGDRVSWRLGRALFWPLLVLGAASVGYWWWTESRGVGDLRLYALVQFLPMILLPLMLLMCPGTARSAPWLWATFAAYFVAKLAEAFDAPIYHALGFSGHSIKHLVSALAALFAIRAILRLEPPLRRIAPSASATEA
jgi:hypothetical protein